MTLPVDPARYAAFLAATPMMAIAPRPANLFAIAAGMRRGRGQAPVGAAWRMTMPGFRRAFAAVGGGPPIAVAVPILTRADRALGATGVRVHVLCISVLERTTMTLKAITLAAALVATAGLSACATATPYQPDVRGQAVSGGYSDIRIDTNRFRVNFAGNSLTSRETVERYLLYRAAELTVGEGGDWFSLVERQTDRKARTYVDPNPITPYGRYGYWRPYWRYYGPSWGWRAWDPWYGDPFWADRIDVHTIEKFEASAEIIVSRGPKPPNDPRAFDAREVMANLGPTIVRPEPE